MAGLGLAGAVEGYMAGQQFAQQKEQAAQQRALQAKQQERQAKIEAAKQSASGIIGKDRERHILEGGDPAAYKPPEDLMFRAAETYSTALAQAGLLDEAMQAQAQVAPMKLQRRQQALQQYDLDKDPEKLARAVYPTMFDGQTIVGSEVIPGAGKVPAFVKLKLSGGKTVELGEDDLVQRIRGTFVNPGESLKREAAMELEMAKRMAQTTGQIAVEKAKSGFEADRDARRAAREAENIAAKAKADRDLADMNNAAADKRNERTVQGGLAQAHASGGYRVKAAETAAGKDGAGNKRDNMLDQAHDELIRSYGVVNINGQRVGDEFTLRGAAYARDLVADGVPMSEAVRKASEAIKAARAKAKPTK